MPILLPTFLAPRALRIRTRLALLAAGAGFAACLGLAGPTLAQDAPWVAAWEAAPQAIPQGPEVPGFRKARALRDQTLRQIFVPQISGSALRVRISNRWGDLPLRIAAAGVAEAAAAGSVRPGSAATLRFDGRPQVVVAPHAAVWSDALPWPVHAGLPVAVDLFLPDTVLPRTWHRLASQVQFVSRRGDHVGESGDHAFEGRLTSYLWLDRADVRPRTPAAALVAIGDSITDGMRSTLNAQRSWPAQLGQRLREHGVHDLAVVDAGISGNRLLSDSACWGPALERRFERDALSVAGVRGVVVLIGINDIDFADTPRLRGLDCDAPHRRVDALQLEQGLAGLTRRAHALGLRVYLGTLTPASLPAKREALRRQLNAWIRADRDVDGIVDFDAALRDPLHPDRMLPRLDSGDHVHPSDTGYAAMATAAWPMALGLAAATR